MRILRDINWRTLVLELFIVFVGLLAALQVDEYRSTREYREAETRYLERLAADLEATAAQTRERIHWLEDNRKAVAHVNDSLQAGFIIDDDIDLFEFGLIYVGHLPSTSVQRSAYDEMVASGMFTRLQSENLKREISDLYMMQLLVEQNFSWWRRSVLDLSDRQEMYVEYYNENRESTRSVLQNVPEPKRRVRFDFDELRGDRIIRNGYYWAADTHGDWVHWNEALLDNAERALTILSKELNNRV